MINAKLASVDKCDCIVIGAGVIGLAIARRMAMGAREVIVLESDEVIGAGISSRNSGVIHAGIYYPSGSLKARFCVEGKRRIYEFCTQFGVAHERVGKILVATDPEQLDTIDHYRRLGHDNGVDDLTPMSQSDVRELEPEVRCESALWSPSTGIIDVHDYMLALLGDAERHGAMVAFKTPFLEATLEKRITVYTGGAQPTRLQTGLLINCAGLQAQTLARCMRGLPETSVPSSYYAKGNYFFLNRPSPFRHLVYPLPTRGSLGVHVSFDLARRCRFGPDIHWVDHLDYAVDTTTSDDFYDAIRRYWPGLPDDTLQPDYTGIRPKLTPQGAPAADFDIQGPEHHGVDGVINLYGIESPGLTSSLAIAEYVHTLAVRCRR